MNRNTLLVTWLGSGLSPVSPGTIGTLAALPFALAIHALLGPALLGLCAALLFFAGVCACNRYLIATGKEDPGEAVIDEVAAMWLALSVTSLTWQNYLAAFLLFRFFDIVKPWPVSWADKHVKGGLGVMLDDTLAALLTIACLALLQLLAIPGVELAYR